ncbi:MAG: MarR family transcriptional regulator [Spirochaetales bacterium]|nr:MarR family transcriptional regulator [Spirochaetales bacterium]
MKRPALGLHLRAINRNMRQLLDGELKQSGISEGQLEYLVTICEKEGINQKELAESLDVGKASVTKAIKILESGGFIQRRKDEKDSRNFCLTTTPAGRALGEECIAKVSRVFGKMIQGFSEEELSLLTKLLAQLHRQSSEALQNGTD